MTAIAFRYVRYGVRGNTRRQVRHIERESGRKALCGANDNGSAHYYVDAAVVESLGLPVCKRCERAWGA